MKKGTKNLIAAISVVSILCSLFCVSAFADRPDPVSSRNMIMISEPESELTVLFMDSAESANIAGSKWLKTSTVTSSGMIDICYLNKKDWGKLSWRYLSDNAYWNPQWGDYNFNGFSTYVKAGQEYTFYLSYTFPSIYSTVNSVTLDVSFLIYRLTDGDEVLTVDSSLTLYRKNVTDNFGVAYIDFVAPEDGEIDHIDFTLNDTYGSSSSFYGNVYQLRFIECSIVNYLPDLAREDIYDKTEDAFNDIDHAQDEALGGKTDDEIQAEVDSAMQFDFDNNFDSGKIDGMNTFYQNCLDAFGTKYFSVLILSCTLGLACFIIGRAYKDRGGG